MGLDMYLHARLSTFKPFNGERHDPIRTALEAIVDANQMPPNDDGIREIDITINVAYWRKANQIHCWFVDHVQGGEDECREHYVEREKLIELRDTCAKLLVKKRRKDAETALPTKGGFFFGSTDYDQYYWADLKATVDQLDRVLAYNNPSVEFYYRASW